MAQYIDKSALVAEIERRKQTWQHQDQQYVNGGKDVCDYLLGFIDTLEVKEVDLDKDIQNVIYNRFFDLNGIAIAGTSLYATVDDMVYIAKYFFELGLKAQKGE